MEKLRRCHVGELVLMFILAAVLVSGCTQKSVNSESAPTVSLSMKVTEPALMRFVDSYQIIVMGDDFGTIVEPLELHGNYIEGEIVVPAGQGRRFVAEALQSTAGGEAAPAVVVIYRSDTVTADVVAGSVIVLEMNLYPVVPLIKLSPRYQQVNGNSLCSLDVKVFNDTGLYAISFRVDFNNYVVRPDSAHPAPGLDTVVTFIDSLNYDSHFYAINIIEPAKQATSIVDSNGNATLATIFFQSFVPEIDPETAVLSIDVIGRTKIGVPMSELYADEGIIEVKSPLLGDSVVTFRDPRLEYAVRNQLEKYSGDIFRSEVEGITSLFAVELGILNLGGLSNLTNLQFLELEYNQISDISDISSLNELGQLFLGWNNIEDISSLAGLPTLFEVDLRYNQIADIHPLYALYPNNTLGTPTNSTDKVWLLGNPVANIAQVDTLCDLSVAVFLYDPGIDWCLQAY